MTVGFNDPDQNDNFPQAYGTIKVAEFELKNVYCYKKYIGILQLLGIAVAVPEAAGKKMLYVNKNSLIAKYRETCQPKGLSDQDLLHMILTSFQKSPFIHQSTPTCQPHIPHYPQKPFIKATKVTIRTIKNGPLANLSIQSGPNPQPARKSKNHIKAEKIVDNIAAFMKSHLDAENTLQSAIQDQYQMLKLMDLKGNWIKSPKLKKMGSALLPPQGCTREACETLINDMACAIKQNPYFLDCLAHIPIKTLLDLQKKLTTSNGHQMLKYLIPYAFVLNSLTAAFAKDNDLFIEVDGIWTKEKPANLRNFLSLFGWVKFKTLGNLSRVKMPIKNHTISADANRHYLNLNILEAVVAERFFTKNKNNSKAGQALLRHPVGGKKNRLTGAGPTTVGVSPYGYEVIKSRPDLPKEWADLYTVWNLAFCSNADNFPLMALKLLIPSVNNYSADPQGYIHHRVIALYLYFQFSIFRQAAGKDFHFLSADWRTDALTAALGEANLKSAQHYEACVRAAKLRH